MIFVLHCRARGSDNRSDGARCGVGDLQYHSKSKKKGILKIKEEEEDEEEEEGE